MHVENRHSLVELKRLACQAKDVRMLRRLQVVILSKQGYTAPEVADATGVSRRALQEWVRRYNANGVDGMKDARHGGYRRHLSSEQERALKTHLDAKANDPQDGIRRGEDLRQWIQEQFNVVYTLDGIYKLLHRLGYSCLMPRPRHKKADAKTQAAFKKTPWRRSNASRTSTRISDSKSGSRTKRALGSKAH